MIGYRIKERLEIWIMSLGLSAGERAQWKRMKAMLSRPEYEGFAMLLSVYLGLKPLEERKERGAIPGKKEQVEKNILILPNPRMHAGFSIIEDNEKRMSADEMKRWTELKQALKGSSALYETARRYAVYKSPIRVRVVLADRE